jgi:hypothetical protein
MKRSLFAGVFDNDSDEVCFAALGQPSFLDGVRELIGAAEPAKPSEEASDGETVVLVRGRDALLAAGVQTVEALAALLRDHGAEALPANLRGRATAALREALDALTADEGE